MDTTLVRIGIPAIALALARPVRRRHLADGRRAGPGGAPAADHPGGRRRRRSGWRRRPPPRCRDSLGRFDLRPPPMVIWFASMMVMTLALAWSPFGRRFADKLPFVALIGFQAFRLPLELIMHRAAVAGIMPNVMSFTGYNFDIVTGATALPLALYAWRRPLPRWLILLWNRPGRSCCSSWPASRSRPRRCSARSATISSTSG